MGGNDWTCAISCIGQDRVDARRRTDRVDPNTERSVLYRYVVCQAKS